MKLTLRKTENKNGTFTYTTTDENGNVVTTRTSKRGNYIACLPEGNFYFSRLDLIGKGDSGRYFRDYPERLLNVAHIVE